MSGEALVAAVVTLLLVAAFMCLGTWGQRGLCKWTRGNSVPMTALKLFVNILTGGLLGLIMNVSLPDQQEPCLPAAEQPDRAR